MEAHTLEMSLKIFDEYISKPGNGHILQSVNVIEKILSDLNYDLSRFCVSFNGGKDCTVILHLVYHVYIKNKIKSETDEINCLYIELSDTFEELRTFIQSSKALYNLNIITVHGVNHKVALSLLKNKPSSSSITHIFMGTRSSDSKKPLKSVQKTDEGWPEYIRVQPMLDWSYHQVWQYLLDLQVPYCSLYDQGYSSIGSKSKTKKNSKLKVLNKDGSIVYLPAYMLEDADSERDTRD